MWAPAFTVIFVELLLFEVANGLATPTCVAFNADCIPLNQADGKPASAAREQALTMWASFIPLTCLPALAGAAFSMFKSREVAYWYLFVWGISVGVVAIACMMMIPANGFVDEMVVDSEVDTVEGARQPTDMPAGAALCDKLLFRRSPVIVRDPQEEDGEEVEDAATEVVAVEAMLSRTMEGNEAKQSVSAK